MRDIPRADHDFEFVGGSLALDFANTLGGMHTTPTHEHLVEYKDLVEFALGGTILSARGTPAQLKRPLANRRVPVSCCAARSSFARRSGASSMRPNVKVVRVDPADLAMIQEMGAPRRHARYSNRPDRHRLRMVRRASLDRPLWEIARSAAELLAAPEATARVRECGSDTCEWLFIDKSRNHSRRWCDMNDCGRRPPLPVSSVRRMRIRHVRAGASSTRVEITRVGGAR